MCDCLNWRGAVCYGSWACSRGCGVYACRGADGYMICNGITVVMRGATIPDGTVI